MRYQVPITLLCGLILLPLSARGSGDFLEEKAMRVDFYHTGSGDQEIFSIDRIYQEPHWGGSRKNFIDTTGLGKYMFRVYDIHTNRLIYSRGFSSIYGEWETTGEAGEGVARTFQESAVFPFPEKSVQFVIAKRNRQGHFEELFNYTIDPGSTGIHREYHGRGYESRKFMYHGDPAKKVDVVIMGDGYTKAEAGKFERDVERFTNRLFEFAPFRERKKDFNIWTIFVESGESGIDEPTNGLWRDNVLGASYNTFDTPRYVLTMDNRVLRDIASNAPYDEIYVIINSNRYGGGGIFNLFAITYTDPEEDWQSWWPEYVFVHEFGHAFAGLGDEYYTSNVAYSDFYPPGVEPWEPNVTALADVGMLKWRHHLEEGTPLPTPWEKVRYDSVSTLRRNLDTESEQYEEERKKLDDERERILKEDPYAGKVGAFEGAGYASEGLYRPSLDCIMFSKALVPFCPVCREAIEKVINFHTE